VNAPLNWDESALYVREKLNEHTKKLDCIDRKLTDLRVAASKEGAKWGAIVSGIVALVSLLR
jgi:hypothetical protein